jgi:phage baseplate assembly protein V
MPGFVEAIVIDNVDPEQLGRVMVKFPMLPDAPKSFWARLVMPMAGRNRGWMTIPEIDDEVLVAFIHGDFSHAIVLGALYNGVDTPPYANEDSQNNLRVMQSRSGHRLTFDDTAGAERIELILHNEEIRVIWDSTAKVLSVYSGKDIIIEAKDTIKMKCKDFVLETDATTNLTAGSNMKIESGAQMNQQASGNYTVEASTIFLN